MKRSGLAVALVHVVLVLACVASLYPVLWVVKMALSPAQSLSLSLNPFPQEVTLDHFRDVLFSHDTQGRWLFGRQLLASVVVSGATTLVGLSLAVTAAYALSRFRFPGKDAGMQTLLVTQMFPATLMLVPLFAILQRLSLLDSWGGLVLVYSTTSLPFCVWMLKGYFDTIPRELEEAAASRGPSGSTSAAAAPSPRNSPPPQRRTRRPSSTTSSPTPPPGRPGSRGSSGTTSSSTASAPSPTA